MENLPRIIEIYLYDFEYKEMLSLLIEDFREANPTDAFKNEIMVKLEAIIDKYTSEQIQSYFCNNTMGIGAWPDDIDPNGEDSYRRLFERIYIDLFKEDPDFKPELLKLEKYE